MIEIVRPIDLALKAAPSPDLLAFWAASVDIIVEHGQHCLVCNRPFSETNVPVVLASSGEDCCAGVCSVCAERPDAELLEQARKRLERRPRIKPRDAQPPKVNAARVLGAARNRIGKPK